MTTECEENLNEVFGAPAMNALKSIKALRVRVACLERQNIILLNRLEELEDEVSTSRDGERYKALLTMAMWGKEKISSYITPRPLCPRNRTDVTSNANTIPPTLTMEEAEEMDDRTLERIERKIASNMVMSENTS